MIPGSANSLLLASAAGAVANYEIERSLRFNAVDSAYLSRTPASAGDRQTWTWSGWAKRSALGAINFGLFGAGSSDFFVRFSDDGGGDILRFYNGSPSVDLQTSSKFRDISSWYHVVVVLDTPQATASNRLKLYVNNTLLTSFATATYPAQNATLSWNNNIAHYIGSMATTVNFFSGYLADIHFIDGQALTPSSFGRTDTNGVWQPKAYTGTYGTNGFKLNFANNSTAAALGTDTSGNGNTWGVNNLSVVQGIPFGSLVTGANAYINAIFDSNLDNDGYFRPGSSGGLAFSGIAQVTATTSFYIKSRSQFNDTGYWVINGVNTGIACNNTSATTYDLSSLCPITIQSIKTSSGDSGDAIYTFWIEVDGQKLISSSETSDSLVDVPTAFGTDTGIGGQVRGNYCTLNPLVGGANIGQITFANGNLDATWNTTIGYAVALGTIGVNSGKWYWETLAAGNSGFWLFGVAKEGVSLTNYIGSDISGYGYYSNDGKTFHSNSASVYGNSYTTNDIISVALDLDNGKVFFAKNGTWQNSGSPTAGTNAAYTGLTGRFFPAYADGASVYATAYSCNFGQHPFVYTAPSGFKALCTQNLPEGTITTSGTFTGNANANGPLVYLNGVPTTMTINGNAVTFATHADKLANGFKLRTNSVSYNTSGSNTYSVSAAGDKFKNARAQINP